MAQGLGGKAKKVFQEVTKQPTNDDDDDSSSSEDDSDSYYDSDDESEFGGFSAMKSAGIPIEMPDFDELPPETREQVYNHIKDQFNKEKMQVILKEGADAYTKWIDQNRDEVIANGDEDKHEKICAMYQEMSAIFTSEADEASEETKLTNSLNVYTIMMKAASHGPPPTAVAQAMANVGSGLTSMEYWNNMDPQMDSCVIQ